MKKSFILLVLASMMTLGLSAQNIIAAWTFDDMVAKPNTVNVIKANADLGELPGTATIYLDGTNGSSKFISTSDSLCQLTSNNGSEINDPREKANKSKDLAMINKSANGYNAIIKFSTKDFADIELTMAVSGSSTGAKTHKWAYSTNGTEFVDIDCENTVSTTYVKRTIDLSKIEAVNNQEFVYIRLTIDGATSNNGSTRLDNIVVRGKYTATDVVAPSLKSFKVNSFTSMNLTFTEPLDSSAAKVENFNILDSAINVTKAVLNGNSIALTFDTIQEAVEYQMVIANVADTAKNVMPNDTITFSFGVAEKFIVKTIAELKAKIDYSNSTVNKKDTVEYKYVGKAIVTAKTAYNNQKFIQDSTGAIVIFDMDGIIKTSVEIGDEVTNIYGKLTNYFGFVELVPTADLTFTNSSFNEVTPLEITLTQLQDMAFMSKHQSELVVVKKVTFVKAGDKFVGPKGKGEKYDIKQDSVTDNAIFINLQESDLIGTTIPAEVVNIVGLAYQDNYTVKDSSNKDVKVNKYYIVPRIKADITAEPVTGIVNNEIKTIAVYPNPTTNFVNVEVEAQNVVAQVFDIYGKLLSTEAISAGYDRIDLSSFSNGLYIIRLSSDNKVIATAKVIKR